MDSIPLWIALIGGAYLLFQGISAFVRLTAEKYLLRQEGQRLQQQIELLYLKHKEEIKREVEWKGYRKFEVKKKVAECQDVYSFYLAPHDKKGISLFQPGQYLTFRAQVKGQSRPVVRCYSLSDRPREDLYRVTVKRVPEMKRGEKVLPPGMVSSYFCDEVQEGDILDVAFPTGHFYLNMEKNRPVVLLSAGVGITPLLSMANTILERAPFREVWFVHGCKNGDDLILSDEVRKLPTKTQTMHLHLCYSRPKKEEKLGLDYHSDGRVTMDVLKAILPSSNYDYYLCGPGPFMSDLVEGLQAWGVPEKDIYFEAFGPASVKKVAKSPAGGTKEEPAFKVTFKRSEIEAPWKEEMSTLLDLAREHEIYIDAGCCAGNCGSCLVAIQSGEVEYLDQPGYDVEEGSCLACICKPKGELVIDA